MSNSTYLDELLQVVSMIMLVFHYISEAFIQKNLVASFDS
jgi:hypothetical protein